MYQQMEIFSIFSTSHWFRYLSLVRNIKHMDLDWIVDPFWKVDLDLDWQSHICDGFGLDWQSKKIGLSNSQCLSNKSVTKRVGSKLSNIPWRHFWSIPLNSEVIYRIIQITGLPDQEIWCNRQILSRPWKGR